MSIQCMKWNIDGRSVWFQTNSLLWTNTSRNIGKRIFFYYNHKLSQHKLSALFTSSMKLVVVDCWPPQRSKSNPWSRYRYRRAISCWPWRCSALQSRWHVHPSSRAYTWRCSQSLSAKSSLLLLSLVESVLTSSSCHCWFQLRVIALTKTWKGTRPFST